MLSRPMAPAVSLRGVAKSYGGHLALQATDLEVEEGEFLCLLGPSGCGKTTLLNLIGGFIRPTSGAVFLGDERVDHLPPNKRDVNTVFQSYALFPHMSVANNVAFGLRMARVEKSQIRARVVEALNLVGLQGSDDRMPAALSGGQQQRVALARALVRRPKVLALDEPFGALDLNLRKRLQLELKQLHQELGITFVFVTHDQDEAMVMSDRVAVMSGGRIEQLSHPSDIYLRPRNRFVAEFVGESNIFDVVQGPSGATFGTAQALLPPALVPAALASGSNSVMLRPELLRVDLQPAPGRVPAELVQATFLGQTSRIELRLTSGLELVAKVAGALSADVVRAVPGTPIHVSWDPSAAVVLATVPTLKQQRRTHD